MEFDKTPKSDVLEILRNVESSRSQNALANDLGYSVGKVNYVIKALLFKGFVKIENFVNSKNKKAYKYLLTQEGLEEKINLTRMFIERKRTEFERLQTELEEDMKRGNNS
ncbi:MarR family EPS-associated transcriptional regulator [Sulfurimonas sp. SAG-AH-194-I05]|nr:MarR family EPS-associated transcriptional regulator [Sulfurimonas sp. SAG-AH-194-I05]MDF1875741.1 MarR family EPS-associated transcriptional regulator [Sulfurimonas sp. SAG-AH-194-I05]